MRKLYGAVLFGLLSFNVMSLSLFGQVTSVQGAIAKGGANNQNPVSIGGEDGSGNIQAIKVSPSGYLTNILAGSGQDGWVNTQVGFVQDVAGVSTLPMQGMMIYNRDTSKWDRLTECNLQASGLLNSASPSVAIALSSGKNIKICSITYSATSTQPVGIRLTSGTGSTCGTGNAVLSEYLYLSGNTSFGIGGNIGVMKTAPVSSDVCINGANGNSYSYQIHYTAF